jgi:hypothetical protein
LTPGDEPGCAAQAPQAAVKNVSGRICRKLPLQAAYCANAAVAVALLNVSAEELLHYTLRDAQAAPGSMRRAYSTNAASLFRCNLRIILRRKTSTMRVHGQGLCDLRRRQSFADQQQHLQLLGAKGRGIGIRRRLSRRRRGIRRKRDRDVSTKIRSARALPYE